jgi:hypothetical protein
MALVWATSVFTVVLGHQPLNVNLRATSADDDEIPALSATSGISLKDRLCWQNLAKSSLFMWIYTAPVFRVPWNRYDDLEGKFVQAQKSQRIMARVSF